MFPLNRRQEGQTGHGAGRWPEVVFGLVPAGLLLAFSLYLLIVGAVGSLIGINGDVTWTWGWSIGLPLTALLGGLSCISLFTVFNLNRRGRWPNALAPTRRRLLTAGLAVGLVLSAGSLLFLFWAGLNLTPLGWPLVLSVFVSPCVVAVHYLFLLHSPGVAR